MIGLFDGKDAINGTGVGIMGIATWAQTNEVLQTIQIVITSVTALVLFGLKVYDWYKKSKKDGKIDQDELNELADLFTKKDDESEEKK